MVPSLNRFHWPKISMAETVKNNMKLARFVTKDVTSPRVGAVIGDSVFDLEKIAP